MRGEGEGEGEVCVDVGALAVAPAEARGDEVRQSARLEEGVLLRGKGQG